MVEKAEWDSDFFGFPVGKMVLNPNENFKEVLSQTTGFELIYVFSEKELNITGLDLVDKKVLYRKSLNSKTISSSKHKTGDIVSFVPEIHSYDQLLTLAYLSGTYSRFKLDRNIPNPLFLDMYKLWLDNSINKEIAFETLVANSEGNISGFVTLGEKTTKCSQIGLIAVNKNYQGKNIASRLLSKCEKLSQKKGFSFMEVATQGENKAACRLYEKNNFKIKSIQYIYHLWNK